MENGTGTGRGTLPEGGQPSEKGKGTSPQTPRTYTDEEFKAAVTKAVSDTEAQKGRDWKGLTQRAEKAEKQVKGFEGEIGTLKTQLDQILKQQEEVELEAARDDPGRLSLFQARQALKVGNEELQKKIRAFEQGKLDQEAELGEYRQYKVTQLAQSIAAKYEGVDPQVLLAVTDGSAEKMEAAAKLISKPKEPVKEQIKPDQGVISGGIGKQSPETGRGKIKAGFDALHPSG